MRRLMLAAFILVAAPAGLTSSLADPNVAGASGPEFQVSSSSFSPDYNYYYRSGPAAGMSDSGDFLVVWTTEWDAMAARAFDASGTPRGAELIFGTGVPQYQAESPDVSAANGQFVTVWTRTSDVPGPGVYYYQLQAQRFSLQGELEGSRMELTPTWIGYNGEVAAEESGDFIVVWHDGYVRLRRFSETGEPSWPMQTIQTRGVLEPAPDVAVDALGNFTVIWSQQDEISGVKGILGKRFDSTGTPLGETFQVSEFTSGYQREQAIAALPDGGFVAVWTSAGQDASNSTGVFGRIFGPNAQPLGGEFQVNVTTAGHQQAPDVSADDRGNFMVVWNSGSSFLRGDLVLGRRFDRSGTPLGGEFPINHCFITGQRLPAVTMRNDGESLVTWFSTQADTPSGSSVRARRFCATPSVSPPEDLLVCAGGTATFSVTTAGRQPFAYQWSKGNTPLQDDGRVSGSASPTLVLSGAGASDADSYACMVVDACAQPQAAVSAAAQLAIEPPPPAVMDLAVQTENGGAMLRFTWTAAAGATDYVVRSDLAPDGGFPVVVGSASDPATGLSVPMTADTEFFLVAARNQACGDGPLR